MAIIKTNETIDGRAFTYTRSDAGFLIKQEDSGQIYTDAYDLVEYPHDYTETDIPIPEEDDMTQEEAYELAARILLGEPDEEGSDDE